MITTVTTTTVTTVTALSTMGFTAAIGIAAVVCLIAFLVTREVAGTSHSIGQVRVAKFATVGIIPLVVAFAVILIVKVLQIIG